MAGVTWALERKLPLEEVARWGVAAGTAAAAREGVGFGARDEVEKLYIKNAYSVQSAPMGPRAACVPPSAPLQL